jgi:hypothetical protein
MACGKRFEDDCGDERTCHVDLGARLCPECQDAEDARVEAEWGWMAEAVKRHRLGGHTCNPHSPEPCRCEETW